MENSERTSGRSCYIFLCISLFLLCLQKHGSLTTDGRVRSYSRTPLTSCCVYLPHGTLIILLLAVNAKHLLIRRHVRSVRLLRLYSPSREIAQVGFQLLSLAETFTFLFLNETYRGQVRYSRTGALRCPRGRTKGSASKPIHAGLQYQLVFNTSIQVTALTQQVIASPYQPWRSPLTLSINPHGA